MEQLKYEMLLEAGLIKLRQCNHEDQKKYKSMENAQTPLPDNIMKIKDIDRGTYYNEIEVMEHSDEEVTQKLLYLQLKNIRTIKRCLIFFTVLATVGIIVGVVLWNILSLQTHYFF